MPVSRSAQKNKQPISVPLEEKKTSPRSSLATTSNELHIVFKLKNGTEIALRAGSNFDICKQQNSTDKKTGITRQVWVPFAYYSRLQGALDGVMHHMLMTSTAQDLAELQLEIKDIRKTLIDCYEDSMQYEA